MFPPCEPRRGGMAPPDMPAWKSKPNTMRPSLEEGSGADALRGPFNNRSETTAQDVMWRDLLRWRMMERELAKPFPHHLLLKHLSFAKILQSSAEASPQCCFSLLEDAEDPAGLKNCLDPSAFAQDHSKKCCNRSFVPSQGVGPAAWGRRNTRRLLSEVRALRCWGNAK